MADVQFGSRYDIHDSQRYAKRAPRPPFAPWTKWAALGGPGNDIPFEQAVSNLAHAVLRDKAPSLLDYELGFQLLDRDEDGTRAAGAIGFQVGNVSVVVPIFFLHGQVKGHEMMWLVNEDLIVPLKESWLNWLINRKPRRTGEGVTKNPSELGVLFPDLARLSRAPYKWGAAMPKWVRAYVSRFVNTVRPTFAEAVKVASEHLRWFSDHINAGRLVKEASRPMLRWIVDQFQRHPALAAQYDRYYGLDSLREAVRISKYSPVVRDLIDGKSVKQAGYRTGSVLGEIDPVKTGALRIITMDVTMTTLPSVLSDREKTQLLRDGIVIQDRRPDREVSTPYRMVTRDVLTNPTTPGLYWVLTATGDFEKCFVGPLGGAISPYVADYLVRPLRRAYVWKLPSTSIWCRSRLPEDEYQAWLRSLPTVRDTDIEERHPEELMIAISPDGKTIDGYFARLKPIVSDMTRRVWQGDTGGVLGQTIYVGDYTRRRVLANQHIVYLPEHDRVCWGRHQCGEKEKIYRLQFSQVADRAGMRLGEGTKQADILEGGKADAMSDEAFDSRQLEEGVKHEREHTDCEAIAKEIAKDHLAEDPDYYAGREDGRKPEDAPDRDGERKEAFYPGTPADAVRVLRTKVAEVKIYNDGCECEINGRRMSPMAALIHLVRDHGLREKAAKEMLKQAAQAYSRTQRWYVKYAAPYAPPPGGTPPYIADTATAPPFPPPPVTGSNMLGFPGPTVVPAQTAVPSSTVNAAMTDPTVQNPSPQYLPAADPEMPGGGAPPETARKEVFDTSLLQTTLRAVRDDTMIDRWLPDLMRGMDRIGRILLAFYWHGQAFQERFGAQDMPELEDSLRNSFEMLGDLVLFLRQRTVQPYPEEDTTSLSLEPLATN